MDHSREHGFHMNIIGLYMLKTQVICQTLQIDVKAGHFLVHKSNIFVQFGNLRHGSFSGTQLPSEHNLPLHVGNSSDLPIFTNLLSMPEKVIKQ